MVQSKLKKFTKKDIEHMFRNLIREELDSDEFWHWVRNWKEEIVVCEEAEEWEIWAKIETLKQYGKIKEEDSFEM